MRTSVILLLLTAACSGSSTGTGGGAGGSGGGSGGGTGGSGGGSGEMLMPCTPAGFTTAPTLVDHLPVTGITSAREHQAYAKFVVKDGGSSISLSLTVEDSASDGGPKVPAAVSVRFNGCDLGAPTDEPGVGKTFSSTDAGAWQPTVSRFLTFEVVSPAGVLLFRDVLTMPSVLPKILAVSTPAGPMAKVDWTPIPDAGITDAFVFGWKRLGTSGLQSVGFSNVSPASGTVVLTLSQAAQLFQLEVQGGATSLGRVRLVSDFDAP